MTDRVPIDPDIARWLAAREGDPTAGDTSVAGRRAHSRAVNELARARVADPPRPASEADAVVAGVPARVFRPDAAGPVPTVVYCHGGGWVAGDVGTHLLPARLLCASIPSVVVSVDYRLAPEHPFPAAFDDCLAVTREVAATPAEYGAGAVAVAGDSAGGQLAASVAIGCRDAGVALGAQLLVVPATDLTGGYESAEINGRYPSRAHDGGGYGLTTADMAEYTAMYAPAERDWRASPIRADLTGVAPAVVCTSGYDPLRDEGRAYARALTAAGVEVVPRDRPELNHGFLGLAGVSAAAAWAATGAAADVAGLLAGRR